MRVSVEGATPAEIAEWERALRRHVGACGCEVGAAFVALTLGVLFLTRIVFGHRLSARPGREIALWIGVGLAAAVLGKLLGLVRSGTALRRVAREIDAVVKRGHG